MRKSILLILGFALSILATSCQTMQGVGRDLRGAGSNIERAATR